MIIHKFPDRPDIIIYPICDVHLGAAEHMEREWESFCKQLFYQQNAYVILGGDLINNATKNSVSNVFEETMRPREQKKRMWNEGMRIYFPEGAESKDYCLLKFVPEMLRAVTVDEIHRYEIKTIVLLKK